MTVDPSYTVQLCLERHHEYAGLAVYLRSMRLRHTAAFVELLAELSAQSVCWHLALSPRLDAGAVLRRTDPPRCDFETLDEALAALLTLQNAALESAETLMNTHRATRPHDRVALAQHVRRLGRAVGVVAGLEARRWDAARGAAALDREARRLTPAISA
jgi:hypothetical protein